MTALVSLVSTLRAAGGRIALVGDRVRVDAPAGLLTDADRAALHRHRDRLVALLEEEERLAAAWAGLTPAERQRFAEEVASGDTLALTVAEALTRARARVGGNE